MPQTAISSSQGGRGQGRQRSLFTKRPELPRGICDQVSRSCFSVFARASVSRVVEAIEYEQQIPRQLKSRIEVETYHSLFWRLLKTHGYLVGLPRRLTILTPPNEAIALSAIRLGFGADSALSDAERAAKHAAENTERRRLAEQEGRVCFDLFETYVGDLFTRSERLRRLFATMYPVVILDEFQDTNAAQWRIVEAIGQFSRLIALADPEQRIFDFIGADPERLNHFREKFAPVEVDFGTTNHRSAGTEIGPFGNDILKGTFQKSSYVGIDCQVFEPYPDAAMSKLVTTTYAARGRLVAGGKADWSLAVLVPTRKITRLVSDSFRSPPGGMAPVVHTAVVEIDAAILGAEIVAHLLQTPKDSKHFGHLIELLCSYYRGKGGEKPTSGALKQADDLAKAHEKWNAALASGKTPNAKSIIKAVSTVYESARAAVLTGDPDKDWRTIRAVLEGGPCPRLREVGSEVRNIRILERGSQLRQSLTQDWRDHGAYLNALEIVRQAFVQDHFATGIKPETGVVIMNMHKAKGKQFDEVIIFEGWPVIRNRKIIANPHRIVRDNDRKHIADNVRQNFRVSVTRGRQKTTILTPKADPCVLLLGNP
ncbi:UvrD-helicase domain-containing protein [Cereibacter sphaeroides]|uniref:UvrD-helicase domain-containing protein n=1 Tax=Cereibacter sphaeroides TaxID=1063 RepID=UPI002F95E5F0